MDARARSLARGALPATLLALVVAALAAWLFDHIGQGHLLHGDEVSAAERAREMLILGDPWTVHRNFAPSFAKPPLYYWFTAGALRVFADPELAVRFGSALYALGCVVLTAGLARRLDRRSFWPALLAALVALANVEFAIDNGRRGMLDTGQTFWFLACLILLLDARERPGRWIGAGAMAAVGALHKHPIGLLLLLVVLALRAARPEDRARLRSRPIAIGLGVATAGAAAWPLLQTALHGDAWLRRTSGVEVAGLLQGVSYLPDYPPWIYLSWLWVYWSGIGPIVAASTAIVAFTPGRFRGRRATWECAVVALGYLAVFSAFEKAEPRYFMPAIPLFSAVAVQLWLRLAEGRTAVVVAGVVALLWLGRAPAAYHLRHPPPELPDQVALSRELGAALRPGETPFFISPAPTRHFSFTHVLFYGDLQRPLVGVSPRRPEEWEAEVARAQPPLRGIVDEAALEQARGFWPRLEVVSRRGGFVHWVLPGPDAPRE